MNTNSRIFSRRGCSEDTGFSDDFIIIPTFVDVHVHLREPGFFYKETIKTGTMAAARSGYSCLFTMPNLNPVPDCFEKLKVQLDIIKEDAVTAVLPFGAITVGEAGCRLSDMEAMAPFVAGFSDDGVGVTSEEIMRAAMTKAASLDKVISAHCEDMDLRNDGYIHEGEYAAAHGHKGICSQSEWAPIKRDLKLAKETGCKYHVCHVSAKESVELIRQAKAEGVNVTCETAPHYLLLSDRDLQEDGKFKMNPPLRSEADRLALIEGIKDGTIDMIATDHAPHTAEEKSKGLAESAMGVTGLEAAFPVLYTELVLKKIITLDKLIELMSLNPRKRFGLPSPQDAGDYAVWDLDYQYAIDPSKFLSKGKSTPFEGRKVFGRCMLTVAGGVEIWRAK